MSGLSRTVAGPDAAATPAFEATPKPALCSSAMNRRSPFHSPTASSGESEDEGIFSTLAGNAFASPLDKLVVIAILTSALSSTQTTILPASRSILSMATAGAMPKRTRSQY